jgi:hypothetical protein
MRKFLFILLFCAPACFGQTFPHDNGPATFSTLADTALTPGNCVQAGTGGVFSTTATPCASGVPSFSILTSGTNTIGAFLIGTGASLGATGSGTITATAMPWAGLTGFPTGCTNQVITALLTTPTCTTLTSAFLPAAIVYTGQTNVYGAFLQDFTSGTVELPEAAGFTTNTNSTIGLDITANITHLWTNNADSLICAQTATDTTTTHAMFATGTAGICNSRAIATGDLPTGIPIGNIGTSGLSGTAPATINAAGAIGCATCVTSSGGGAETATAPVTITAAGLIACATCATTTNGGALSATAPDTISAAGVIACATCVTSAASLTSNVLPKGSGGAQGVANSLATDNGTTMTYTGTGGYSAPVLVSSVATGTAPLTVTSTTPVTNLTLSTAAQVPSLPLQQIISPTGAVAAYALGTNVVTFNCATASAVSCFTIGETTAATTATAVEHQISTLTTSAATALQISQGANGPANTNAPPIINIAAAAAGGLAGASNNGNVGAPINLITGAGSAGGATTGNGSNGGNFNVTTGNGGAPGGTATNNGGQGGNLVYITGAGGNGGTGAGTAGSGGNFSVSLGIPGTNSATGTLGAMGQFVVQGQAVLPSTSNAAGEVPGTIFLVNGVTGGASSNAAGTGGVGSLVALNSGAGGAGTGTNGIGGAGGSFTVASGTGGAALGTGTGGAGGAINNNTGAGVAGGATGGGGAAGVYQFTGGVGGAGGATSGTGGAGGDFLVTTGAGGAATAGSTTGRGGNATFTLGSAGGTGTAGLPGQFKIVGGTVGAANTTQFLNLTGTWNTTGVVDAAIFENITNTASGTGSLLLDLQLGGASELKLEKTGLLTAANIIQSTVGTQTVSGADYTNSTTTPSTLFSWTLPATAAAKNYRYTCDITWESTNTTLVGPVFGLNMSAAPTQLTGTGIVNSSLTTVSQAELYLSNTTTGSQTLVTGAAAAVTATNYSAKIYGTIEGAPVAGSTFIINAASTSGTTATLNIRRGSGCTLN